MRGGVPTDYGRILIGLIILALGTLMVLDAAGTLDAGDAASHWWPTVIIAVGLFQLLEGRPSPVGPLLVMGFGTIVLLFTTNVLAENEEDYVWGGALIAIGLLILTRWATRASRGRAADGEQMRVDGIFGGPDVATTSQAFRGAALTAVFGGVTFDLRRALPVAGGAAINATAVFGGIELIVPRGWRIVLGGTPIFGGIEDKTNRSQVLAEDAPILYVDAFALFGGVEIKHEKKKTD
jgi:hypothetical protein